MSFGVGYLVYVAVNLGKRGQAGLLPALMENSPFL